MKTRSSGSRFMSASLTIAFILTIMPRSAFAQNAPTPPPAKLSLFESLNQTNLKPTDDNDKQNQERYLKDQKNSIENYSREVKDIKKDAKNADTSKVEGLIKSYSSCLDKLSVYSGTNQFWDLNRDCDDIRKTVEDEFNDNLRPQRDCAQRVRDVDGRKREKKDNIDRQMKDILRQNKTADLSALNAIVTKITDAFAKADALSTGSCNRDTTDALSDILTDLNDLFRDYYDTANEVQQTANEARQLEDSKKDFEKNLKKRCEKDFTREFKNFEKEIEKIRKKKGTLPADAEEAYTSVKTMFNTICVDSINAMQDALNKNDFEAFNDARQSYQENEQDFWNTLNEARQISGKQQQAEDALKDIKQREKDIGNMRKEYDRAVKKTGSDIPEAKDNLTKVESLMEEAKKAVEQDPQSWWQDYQQQLNDLQQDFWNSFQKVQQVGDLQRWFKDLSKEVGFREKDLKNMRRDKGLDQGVLDQLQGLLDKSKQTLEEAKNIMGTDPDAARDLLQSLDEIRQNWDELTRSMNQGKEFKFMIEQVMREINHAEEAIQRWLKQGALSKEDGDRCLSFIADVKQKLPTLKFGEGENPEEYMGNLEQQAFEVCPILQKLEDTAPDRDFYRQFMKENVDFNDQAQDLASSMMEKMSGEIIDRVMQKMLSDSGVFEQLLQSAGKRFENQLAQSLSGVTGGLYDDNAQRSLLQKKAEIMDLSNQLESLQKQVQIAQDKLKELQGIQDEIASYNFYGAAGDDIKDDIESFVNRAKNEKLSKDEIRKGIDELRAKKDEAISKSKDAKLDAGVIPFFDTDDNEWFTTFAKDVKNLGWITGTGTSGGRDFNPSGLTNVAEAITMFARVKGIDDTASPLSSVGKRLPEWAQAAAGSLEANGVDLQDIFGGKNAGDTVSRAEVARLLKQVLGLPDTDPKEADSFTDIKQANGDEKAAIAAVKTAGIMTGQGGTTKFDVKGPLNRAALAKILKISAELAGIRVEAPQPPGFEDNMKDEKGSNEEGE